MFVVVALIILSTVTIGKGIESIQAGTRGGIFLTALGVVALLGSVMFAVSAV